MNKALIARFSLMMFFQYMIWGLWFIKLGPYLTHLGFDGVQVGAIFGVFFLASLISPFIGGQIADRILPTQVFMGLVHLLGGVILLYMATISDFSHMWWVFFGYSLLYAPTLALTNSICFHHLENKEKEFGIVRAFGTIGWIAAGGLLTFWFLFVQPFGVDNFDQILEKFSVEEQAAQIQHYLSIESMIYTLAGIVSMIMGVYCFTLPHTPPSRDAGNPLAFVEALKLFKDPNFAFFMLLGFVVSTELMFYYIPTPGFLETMIPSDWVPFCTTLAQIGELVTLLVILPYALPRLGIRKTIAIGIIAWPIRYAVFALGQPTGLILFVLPLHGICYVFFFIVGQIYVDKVAPANIRASAQSLYFMNVFGLGLFLGSYFVGWIQRLFTDTSVTPNVVNYTGLFLVPCVLTVICAVVFLLFFKDPEENGEKSETA
jgi:nucleoside transporter